MSDELIAYYTARAKGGIGMILTEYAFVTPEGRSSDHQISIADDSVIPGLKEADTLTGLQVLQGVQPGGKKVLVLGGGAQGAETADHLGDYGYDVTVV